jgi:hypothetical protein
MNTNEAIHEIEGTVKENRDAVSRILAAGMIADATNRLADEKKRQMDMQETLMKRMSPMLDMYVDMIAKMGPAVDASMQAMKDELKDREEGESWKHGKQDDENEN